MADRGALDVVVGLQWGDEGKAKVTDCLAERYNVVARFQGGANAGHTVVTPEGEFIFNLVPAGLLRQDTGGLIGAGVVLEPEVLLKEMRAIESFSGPLAGRFTIDGRCHIVTRVHKLQDWWEEEMKGGWGTTKRGIGPVHRDRHARYGIRLADLASEHSLTLALESLLSFSNDLFAGRYNKPSLGPEEMKEELLSFYDAVRPYVGDAQAGVSGMLQSGVDVLCEGAQGSLLDVLFGTYPWVTSSHTTAAAAPLGLGLGPNSVGRVWGVFKAYTTRVGKGPFPTEERGDAGRRFRERAGEYGSVTGRPRRCGWLDLPLLKYACALNGVTDLAITKMDMLDGFESVKVAVGYRLDGEQMESAPVWELESLTPVYEELPGWDGSSDATTLDELPSGAREYIRFVEEFTQTPVKVVSNGRARKDWIEVA